MRRSSARTRVVLAFALMAFAAPCLAVAQPPPVPQPPPQVERPRDPDTARQPRFYSRGRVRLGGTLTVEPDEAVTGDVVAILGRARIEGVVRGDVVAVLGDIELGPRAE